MEKNLLSQVSQRNSEETAIVEIRTYRAVGIKTVEVLYKATPGGLLTIVKFRCISNPLFSLYPILSTISLVKKESFLQ
jgi:hypothetical protein